MSPLCLARSRCVGANKPWALLPDNVTGPATYVQLALLKIDQDSDCDGQQRLAAPLHVLRWSALAFSGANWNLMRKRYI